MRFGHRALTLLALVMLALAVPAPSGGIDVQVGTFSNGLAGAAVVFPSAGSNSSLSVSIQTGMRASQVFFNISGEPYTPGGTDCPMSPSLDLGADSDLEWQFNGTGYGALGHQHLLSDGSSFLRERFTAAGASDAMKIRLPAGASVLDASFDLKPSNFTGPSVNVSIDIGADNITDWSNATLGGQVTVSGLGSLLGAYLASAPVSGGDQYGVTYVDIPVRLRSGSAANLTVTNLSVRYDVTLTTPNLALRLNSLVPGTLGSSNISVIAMVSAGSAGVLRIRDMAIVVRTPLHAPDLLDPDPPLSPDVAMDENESLLFSVKVQDKYGDPVAVQWFVDVLPVAGANGTSLLFATNYTSSGRHSVTITAGNGLSESSLTWWINVADVNLPPVIRSFSPASAGVAEGSQLAFSVDAYDPDGGALAYAWTLDGAQQGDRDATFVYAPPIGSAGYHAVALLVSDAGGRSTLLNWTVLVRKTNMPPVIGSFSPASDPVIREGQTAQFSVSASDPNGDPLTYEWVLNGYSAGFGQVYNWSPDFASAGNWSLRALVRDGDFTAGHTWNITVIDVNHDPVAVLDSPHEGDVFRDRDRITLSARGSSDPDGDALVCKWYEGPALLAEGMTANLSLPRGAHRLRLQVEDGKGGRAAAEVNVTVRTDRISADMGLSSQSPREGDRLRVRLRVGNTGDTVQEDVPVTLLVDGVPTTKRTIARILPGENTTLYFQWTAEPGRHDLAIDAGNESAVLLVTVAPGIPSLAYYMVFSLVGGLIAVVVLAWAFFIQWNRAISQGIVDESKRRGRKELGKSGKGDDRKPLGFFNIRLAFSPFKEKPLEIETTMPEDRPVQDSIRESLTPASRSFMSSPAPAGKHPRSAAPVTASVFAAKRAAQPSASDVELPIAHPAPPGSEPSPLPPPPPPPPPAVQGAPEGPGKPLRAPLPPPPAAAPAPQSPKGARTPADKVARPKKRLEDIEDRMHALEKKGADVAGPRRFLSLAKSFWKGGNTEKAEQYLEKADAKLDELERSSGPAAAGLACKKCGAPVDPAWIVCPECEAKLK